MVGKNPMLLLRRINSRLVTSCILSLLLITTSAALAEYKPPPDQKPPGDQTGTTGPRTGCEGKDEGTPLIVLAPQTHVGQTTFTHPTFVWFVPDSTTKPMEFRLYAYEPNGDLKQVGEPISLQSSSGIMKLSLSADQPGLIVGQTYLWQVTIICNPDSPSADLMTAAEIKIVEMPSVLEKNLSTTVDRSKRADLYAEAGLWYDALSEALELAGTSQLGELGSTLLEDLTRMEEAETVQELTQEQKERLESLRQIASRHR